MRLTRVLVITLAMFCLIGPPTAQAGTPARGSGIDWFPQLFGCKHKELCVIRYNPGGIPILFELAAVSALQSNTQIRIEGVCASACLLFASRVRSNVCITPSAQMGIHRGTRTTVYEPFGKEVDITSSSGRSIYLKPPPGYRVEKTFFLPDFGEDINEWALAENKIVYDGMYFMTHAEALRFWKPCR